MRWFLHICSGPFWNSGHTGIAWAAPELTGMDWAFAELQGRSGMAYIIRAYAWRQIESKSSLLFYIHIRKALLAQILHLPKPSPACSALLLCIILPWSSMALSCTWMPFLFALVTTVYTLAFTFKGTRDPVEVGCATTWSDFGFSLCHDNGIDWR